MPLVYELDATLKPIKHYYLGDPEEIRKAPLASPTRARRNRYQVHASPHAPHSRKFHDRKWLGFINPADGVTLRMRVTTYVSLGPSARPHEMPALKPHGSINRRMHTSVKIGAQLWRRSGSCANTGSLRLLFFLSLGERQHDSHLRTRRSPGPTVSGGKPWPLGVEWIEAEDAFNFALYSRYATGVTLLCYGEKDPASRSSSFAFSIRRTRPGASGIAASRRASFAAPRYMPTASRGRRTRSTGSGSIRRRSCSIPTRRRCSSRRSSAAKPARSPGPTDGRAPLGRLPKKEADGRSDSSTRPALHLPRRHRL